jgi:hypothetical protein
MLALLMTYADDWTFNRDHLMKVARIGRDRFQRIMRELMAAGYVSREAVRGDAGKVAGSTWFINDEPDREPENPVVGDTEGLNNRQPGKPTAGFSGPLRKPKEKKTKREECVGEKHDAAFDRFWSIYPRPRGREKSRDLFLKLASDGVDPARLITAAERYRNENRGNGAMYLCYSDNWLADGRWKDDADVGAPAPDACAVEATARHLAEKARAGKPLFGVTETMRQAMLDLNLVTPEELRRAGVAP